MEILVKIINIELMSLMLRFLYMDFKWFIKMGFNVLNWYEYDNYIIVWKINNKYYLVFWFIKFIFVMLGLC